MSGRRWTDKEDRLLKKMVKEGFLRKEIASVLGRSVLATQSRTIRLHLTTSRKWTDAENNYLMDYFSERSYEALAKKLRRTPIAVKAQCIKLGLGSRRNSLPGILLYQLVEAIYSRQDKHYADRMLKNGLPTRTIKNLYGEGKDCTYIDIDEFWSWLETHQDAVSLADLEENAIGGEPLWAKQKRKADWHKKYDKRYGLK